ncbi:syntaxin [Diplonema papillatum]|nr:syntaxin [Diplonema papillatum]
MADLDVFLRRLETVAYHLGIPGESADDADVDTSGMTKYESERYKVALMISRVREDTKVLDNLPPDTPNFASKKAEISNRIRKTLRDMKQHSQELRSTAVKEGKEHDYSNLCRHLKKTESMYRQRYRVAGMHDDMDTTYGTMTLSKPFGELGASTTLGGLQPIFTSDEPLMDPQDDPEFQVYFQEAQKRDETIDHGLVRVHQSLGRIKYAALETQAELDRQAAALDNANTKAADITQRLKGLNDKLKETVTSVEKDKYCCYVICLLLIVGVLGVVLTQTNILGRRDKD